MNPYYYALIRFSTSIISYSRCPLGMFSQHSCDKGVPWISKKIFEKIPQSEKVPNFLHLSPSITFNFKITHPFHNSYDLFFFFFFCFSWRKARVETLPTYPTPLQKKNCRKKTKTAKKKERKKKNVWKDPHIFFNHIPQPPLPYFNPHDHNEALPLQQENNPKTMQNNYEIIKKRNQLLELEENIERRGSTGCSGCPFK